MNKEIKNIAIAFACTGVLLAPGCASHKAGKNITATPSEYLITPDASNSADLDVTLHIPAHYISSRSRIVITPQLISGDSLIKEYPQKAVYAPVYTKKVMRQMVLDHYVDPYFLTAAKLKTTALPYNLSLTEKIELPEGLETARMIAVVSSDGCGVCTGIDTVTIATLGSPITLIVPKEELKITWIEPEFKITPKVREGKGVANLQFAMNKYDIDPSLGKNRSELDSIVAKLAPILSDSLATVTSLDIFGMASADGSLAINTKLAKNRADAAKDWLAGRMNIPVRVQRIIKTGSRPEGWQPVLDAMIADNHPDAGKVKEIIEKYADQNDDVAEKYIRRLACWNDIKNKYLQKDRKVEYVYTYTIKSFTDDAELLDMYKKRPDAFNESELFRVASLAKDDDSRKQVYLTLMKYFPQSEIGANNLAVLYLNEGDTEAAKAILEKQKNYTPEQLNTLAATFIYEGNHQRAIELLEESDLPEARYNLGLIKAKERKFEEAYELLQPYSDINSAIAALSLNKNEEARKIMSQIDDTRPLAKYVNALIAARFNDNEAALTNLAKACEEERFRKRAIEEPDFMKYADNEQFNSIIGK